MKTNKKLLGMLTFGMMLLAHAVMADVAGSMLTLDGDAWRLATDPKNEGREQKWPGVPVPGAKPTKVPWIIQDAFPGYHGVAWYWREFEAPTNPHAGGRHLLRFWAVDYLAEVWLNGMRVGGHEGGETPFVIDVTDSIRAGAKNLLAVRVLNPSHERIDGIVLNETPKQARVIPYNAGAAYNHGGITGSVELLATPAVRVEDLFAQADPKTGTIRIQANVRNASIKNSRGRLEFTVAPAASGETLREVAIERELPPGDTRVEAEVNLDQPRLWELNDPFLYRVTARLGDDEQSVRCGFRDFRFENGYFRLNGRRVFLRSTHTCNHFPVGLKLPPDPDMARRDLLDLKVMGFNMIRFIWGGAERYQLDLCDEIGLMVYEESFASWPIQDSPQLAERWERSISELIRRDRNHPSVVIWGLLNEVKATPHFWLAANSLPLVRKLDPTRMVFLNSGRYDETGGGDAGDEVFSKLDVWRSPADREPWAARNPSDQPVPTPFNFTWPPRQVALHPGPHGQYSVVRWTAPAEGRYQFAARFDGLAKATTDVHILHNSRPRFDAELNIGGKPNTATHTGELALAKDDTIDFVVGRGDGYYGSDSTALTATIKSAAGRVFDLAAEFPHGQNPAGPWSSGWLVPGEKPNTATFTRYVQLKVRQRRSGTLANPGSVEWADPVADEHRYPRVPHTAGTVQALRSAGGGTMLLPGTAGETVYSKRPCTFLSEYGIGSAVDLWRTTRHFERLGKTEGEDARFYRNKLDRYLADWKQWKLDELYARPEDFFAESLRKMAGQRTLGLNAIRANPNIVGYSLTGMNDHVSCGEGLTTTFRELKPGTVDAMFEGLAPLRLCLFAEPVNVYRGARIRFEAVLANEDALAPGDYPVKLLVVGPQNQRIFEKIVSVTIAEKEAPLALPIFAEDVVVNGPSGRYRFLASFEHGAAATGGETGFYVTDPADMPAVKTEVVLAGDDAGLAKWLGEHGIRCRTLTAAGEATPREVILVSKTPPATPALEELWRRVQRGATAIFLAPEVLKKGDHPFGWLPLANKGSSSYLDMWGGLYLKDEWAKRHPIFDGLPSGGLMDYTFYREIIPGLVLAGQDPPAEAVAGAIKASQDYSSGLMLAVYKSGSGRFILNTLLIRETLGSHPAAERLLRNLLNYGGLHR
ncbi:MAG: glycoside hydrolase family 2 [Kiritimatiellaeota bacterium]|nr:glycoside hydrolase family 2 [Kiritimatiellota bacterium]